MRSKLAYQFLKPRSVWCDRTVSQSWFLGNDGRNNNCWSKRSQTTDLNIPAINWTYYGNMPRERDPFPFPRYENDNTFTGSKEMQKLFYDEPTHLAQNNEPWRRLYNTATMSSSRRNIFNRDNTAPQDSLDIHLRSIYDHHIGLFKNKSQTVTQKKTVSEDHGKYSEAPVHETEYKGIKVWVDSQKASIHSIKGTIESHHTASTNRGYSRKHDGGFYST